MARAKPVSTDNPQSDQKKSEFLVPVEVSAFGLEPGQVVAFRPNPVRTGLVALTCWDGQRAAQLGRIVAIDVELDDGRRSRVDRTDILGVAASATTFVESLEKPTPSLRRSKTPPRA